MKKTQEKSSIGFWAFYIIFILALVGFWIYFLNGVIKKDLDIYEAAQPGYVMEEVVKKISLDIKNLSDRVENLIIVSNDIFSSGEEYGKETYEYMKALGEINKDTVIIVAKSLEDYKIFTVAELLPESFTLA